MAAAFSGFSVFLFNSSVLIISLLVMESISCCLISSFLSGLVFVMFSEPFCSCKQKNDRYTTNIKHPLHTKNTMGNLILRLY